MQSDQSSLCTQWVAKDPNFLHADSEDSDDDQTGQMPRLSAQSDQSLRWALRSFYGFGHASAQFQLIISCVSKVQITGINY